MKNRDQAAARVDRHVRGIRPAVAEGPAAGRPAQAIALGDLRAGLPMSHLRHGRPGQVAPVVELAAVEDHPAEPGQLIGRREQSAGRNRSARAVVERVGELADGRLLEGARLAATGAAGACCRPSGPL